VGFALHEQLVNRYGGDDISEAIVSESHNHGIEAIG